MKNNTIPYEAFGRAIQTNVLSLGLSGAVPVNNTFLPTTITRHKSSYRLDGSYISTPIYEPLSIISQDAAGTEFDVPYQFNLGMFHDTILSINKTLYFGDNLILTLQFNPATKYSWKNTPGSAGVSTSTTLTDGVAAVQYTPIGGATIQTVQPSLTGISLYMAVETDPVVVSQLVTKVNGDGFSITIPYVYCTKTNVTVSKGAAAAAGSGSFAIQQRITRGYGHRLLRCYSAVFGSDCSSTMPATNQCIMTSNYPDQSGMTPVAVTGFTLNQHSDVFLKDYNSAMDGLRLQDFLVTPLDATHWMINEPLLRGSCIMSLDQYKNQCMHIDSWTGKPVCEDDDTMDNGLSLDADKTYALNYNLFNIGIGTSLNHFLWFTVQRSLNIKGNQIILL